VDRGSKKVEWYTLPAMMLRNRMYVLIYYNLVLVLVHGMGTEMQNAIQKNGIFTSFRT
jgi:hypothetical protein